jgi:hypothetical protein
MPDISTMIKSIKIAWVQRLLGKNNNFTKLAQYVTGKDNFLHLFGYKNDIRYIKDTIPPFYKQILEYWYQLYSSDPIKPNDILNEKVWYNRNILVDGIPMFYKLWSEKGINSIHDIVDNDGILLTQEGLQNKFDINIPTMLFNSLKTAIPKQWKNKIKDYHEYTPKPNQLFIKINNIEKELETLCCKDFYWEYISKCNIKPKCTEKWEKIYHFIDFDWLHIHSLPYLVARETYLQSLQYQILNRYIPCKYMLKIWKKEESDQCPICNETDDIEHFFFKCNKPTPFLNSFIHWFSTIMATRIILGTFDIIFGVPNQTNDMLLNCLNYCLLLAKSLIYNCHMEEKICTFLQYKVKLQRRLEAELCIAELNNTRAKFYEQWQLIYDALG